MDAALYKQLRTADMHMMYVFVEDYVMLIKQNMPQTLDAIVQATSK